jgi:hypothetical protein
LGPLTVSRAERLRLLWPHLRGGVLETAAAVTGVWQRTTLPLTTNGTEAVTFVPPTNKKPVFPGGAIAHHAKDEQDC